MNILNSALAVARFFYKFVVGDDWVVAAVTLVGLVLTGVLVADGVNAWWLVPVLAVLMTCVSLQRRRA
jgi:hypothetical protein